MPEQEDYTRCQNRRRWQSRRRMAEQRTMIKQEDDDRAGDQWQSKGSVTEQEKMA